MQRLSSLLGLCALLLLLACTLTHAQTTTELGPVSATGAAGSFVEPTSPPYGPRVYISATATGSALVAAHSTVELVMSVSDWVHGPRDLIYSAACKDSEGVAVGSLSSPQFAVKPDESQAFIYFTTPARAGVWTCSFLYVDGDSRLNHAELNDVVVETFLPPIHAESPPPSGEGSCTLGGTCTIPVHTDAPVNNGGLVLDVHCDAGSASQATIAPGASTGSFVFTAPTTGGATTVTCELEYSSGDEGYTSCGTTVIIVVSDPGSGGNEGGENEQPPITTTSTGADAGAGGDDTNTPPETETSTAGSGSGEDTTTTPTGGNEGGNEGGNDVTSTAPGDETSNPPADTTSTAPASDNNDNTDTENNAGAASTAPSGGNTTPENNNNNNNNGAGSSAGNTNNNNAGGGGAGQTSTAPAVIITPAASSTGVLGEELPPPANQVVNNGGSNNQLSGDITKGLSNGAKAAIGLGVAVGALMVAGGIYWALVASGKIGAGAAAAAAPAAGEPASLAADAQV